MSGKNVVIESFNGFKEVFEEEGLFIVIDKSVPDGDENPVMEIHFPNEEYEDDEEIESDNEEDMLVFYLQFLESEIEENRHGHLILFSKCSVQGLEFDDYDFLKLINALNNMCDIGFFAYDSESEMVIYRHVFQTNKGEVTSPDVVLEELPDIVVSNELFLASMAKLLSADAGEDIEELVRSAYDEIMDEAR